MARHSVATLIGPPVVAIHQARCSANVASGAASRRARKAASRSGPMRRGPPGIALGASSPLAACWRR